MKYFIILIVSLITLISFSTAQSVGLGTTTPDTSAILELKSINKGLLIPRLTQVERTNIIAPAQGLIIYQTDNDTGFHFFKGSRWRTLTENNQSGNQLDKILYYKEYSVSGIGMREYWIANTDGTNQYQIPITPPAGMQIGANGARLTPDGSKLIFTIYDPPNNRNYIYSCLLNGSNLTKLVDAATGQYYNVEGAY